jgi:GNAT superfamily N-acetyltransferase
VDATIRSALEGDERSLFALTSQFPTPTPCGLEVFRELLQSKLDDPASALLVAEHDGALIGYVSGRFHAAFYAAGVTAWVDEILVTSAFRGHGVGGQLMSAFEAWAAHNSCILVALATRGAAPFYEHLGYASKAGYFKKYLAGIQAP